MIFTLTDRHYNVLDAYETDDYLIGQYIGSILETLEINVLVKSLNAEHWTEGNYIMCQDKRGKKRWFTIYDCEDSHSGDVKSLFCYSGTIDIVAEDAAPISASEAKPFKWYFDQIFYDTGIELGINEISDLTRKLEFTSENASNAEMLQYVLNGFDNAEASLDVEFDGATPTKLVLNVYKRIGNEEPQTVLSDEDDSLTSLDRKGSISDLATCINPTGAEDENGNPITLLGKYYEERDEQGNILYYSPVDSPRVFSVVARRDFYVQLPGKANGEFDGYINRRYESQATTQDTLWQESLAQLKKIDHVAVTYEANGYIDCAIGDNVQIVSHEMKPPVMIAARTIEYKFNDDDPSRNVYKFGNYVELTSNLDDLAKIIGEVKKQVEPQVVEAERNAKIYAETISVEKAAQAESNAKGYTDTVKVQVVEHANTVANQAENNAKEHADMVADEAESNAKAYALSEADKAKIAAIQAKRDAQNAQITADGKNTVFYQATAPSTAGRKINDLWYDTDDGYKPYYFNGSSWIPAPFGNAAIANLDAGKITTGYLSAARIAAKSIDVSKLNVTELSAITANLGNITAGTIRGVIIEGASIKQVNEDGSIELSNNGLHLKDASGKERVSLDTSNDDFQGFSPSSITFDKNSGAWKMMIGTGLHGLGDGFVGYPENLEVERTLVIQNNGYTQTTNGRASKILMVTPRVELSGILTIGQSDFTDGSIELVNSGYTYIDFKLDKYRDYDARIIFEKADGSLRFGYGNGGYRHIFYPNGTKSGGSIEIDGKILGMSPIDSPQVLLETIEFDVPLTETGTKVLLDMRFAKAVNHKFAVFPNRGEVIEKGDDYFIIAGEGLADIRIVGERVGYAGVYFDDMTVEGVI